MANVETWARGGKRRGSRRAFERSGGEIPLFLRTDRILSRRCHTTASIKKVAFGLNAYKSKNLYAVTPHGRCARWGREMQGLRVRTAHDTIEVDDDARERCASHSGSRAMSDVRVALPAALRQREGLFRVSRPGCDLDAHRRRARAWQAPTWDAAAAGVRDAIAEVFAP